MSDLMKVYEDIEQVTLKLSEDNLYSGNLILVNRDNEFKQSKLELIAVDSSYFEIFGEKPIYINKVMKDPLLNLIDDINGKRKLIAVSGFISEEEQRDIVGVAHARLMNKYNYCLEEYIDFLRQFKFNKNHLKLKEDNSEIEIFFVEKVDKLMEINIMKNTKYDVSGNNVDGFIITLFNAMGE